MDTKYIIKSYYAETEEDDYRTGMSGKLGSSWSNVQLPVAGEYDSPRSARRRCRTSTGTTSARTGGRTIQVTRTTGRDGTPTFSSTGSIVKLTTTNWSNGG